MSLVAIKLVFSDEFVTRRCHSTGCDCAFAYPAHLDGLDRRGLSLADAGPRAGPR